MQSTFSDITDILTLLNASTPNAPSKNTIDSCINLLDNIDNIHNYKCTNNQVINCDYKSQTEFINSISGIQKLMYTSDDFLIGVSCNQISDLVKEVIGIFSYF